MDNFSDLEKLKGLYSNRFIDNNYDKGRKVSYELNHLLSTCEEFIFSVAFITYSGIEQIKGELLNARDLNKKGKILTTNFEYFTEPKALEDLIENFPNIEIRMFDVNKEAINFHTKGYIFKKNDKYKFLIGSSNLTQDAITRNEEWNSLIEADLNSSISKDLLDEFNIVFNKATPINEIIDEYKVKYNEFKEKRKLVVSKQSNKIKTIKPNSMQLNFIDSLNSLIENQENRGLLISATGTGKTIASILALKNLKGLKVKKLLFVTHRLSILIRAKEVYDFFFNSEFTSSLLTGENKENIEADFIFASSSTINKKEYYQKFKEDYFDFIIIDEVHRVGDNSYLNLINYFKPKFLLGMSATPDRSDGYDLYKLFDHNIAYEIRILDALKEDLLAPFVYFGVTDLTVNNELIDDYSSFNLLTANERVKKIIDKSNFYGFSGDRVKGLIFVRSIEEGKALEEKFKEFNKKVKFLSGESSLIERENAIKLLEEENPLKEHLDYILTVDIFNEGVDIPSVNQIIFLRPTQSSIIFLQQLGRGLRKYQGKENVVVIDFIGNYASNFKIAKALCKKSATKEELIKTVEGLLPGAASIQFEEKAKEEVFKSIKNSSLSNAKEIFNQYIDVKNKLGRIPSLVEFEKYGGESKISSRVFLDFKSSYDSYYDFLFKKEDAYKGIKLSEEKVKILEYFGSFYLNGIRKKDIEILQDLINFKKINLVDKKFNEEEIKYYLSILNFSYGDITIKQYPKLVEMVNNNLEITSYFEELLKDKIFFKLLKLDIEYAKYSNQNTFNSSNDLVLFERYQRKDVSRMINKEVNISSTVYGYQLYKDKNVCPIFVDYDKKEDQISYNDHFLSKEIFHWNSRKNRYIDKGEIKDIILGYKNNKLKILLFVQKSSEDGFYYLGECQILSYYQSEDEFIEKGETVKANVVHFDLKLINECRSDIYNYLTSKLN